MWSFIIPRVAEHPRDIARVAAAHFGVSRQSIAHHLRELVARGILEATGRTRARAYQLKVIASRQEVFPISPGLTEDRVWREFVAPVLASLPQSIVTLPKNVVEICQYGFSEIFNNVLEHSDGTVASVEAVTTAGSVAVSVQDDGVGIFTNIKNKLGLDDERDAVLELVKGKLTTDPRGHTGEGIFFTSRMFDDFQILSGDIYFSHTEPRGDWLLESQKHNRGTRVRMRISCGSSRTMKEVFDRFATDPTSYDFTKTHVPVELLRYGEENLVSRSQARRLLARSERFREVMLDFHGVPTIGQAFADEIFRVFHRENPQVRVLWDNATPEVEAMIRRALRAREEEKAREQPSPSVLGTQGPPEASN